MGARDGTRAGAAHRPLGKVRGRGTPVPSLVLDRPVLYAFIRHLTARERFRALLDQLPDTRARYKEPGLPLLVAAVTAARWSHLSLLEQADRYQHRFDFGIAGVNVAQLTMAVVTGNATATFTTLLPQGTSLPATGGAGAGARPSRRRRAPWSAAAVLARSGA